VLRTKPARAGRAVRSVRGRVHGEGRMDPAGGIPVRQQSKKETNGGAAPAPSRPPYEASLKKEMAYREGRTRIQTRHARRKAKKQKK